MTCDCRIDRNDSVSLCNLILSLIFKQTHSNIYFYTISFQLPSLYSLVLTSIFKQSYLNILLYMVSFQHLFLHSSFLFLHLSLCNLIFLHCLILLYIATQSYFNIYLYSCIPISIFI